VLRKDLGVRVNGSHHHVDAPVVVEIGKGRTVMQRRNLEVPPRKRRDIVKPPTSHVAQDAVRERRIGGPARPRAGKVGCRKEQVFAPVIVEIEHAKAPAGQFLGRARKPRRAGFIGKEPRRPDIPVQWKRLEVHAIEHDVFQTIVIEIAKISAHAGDGIAVNRIGNAFLQGHFFELAVAQVLEQEIRNGIIGHEYVRESVSVEIAKCHGKPFDCHPRVYQPLPNAT